MTAHASPLGKSTAYCQHYAPDLLFPIQRQEKRLEIGLADDAPLPFYGADLWHGYELSWLNSKGKPMVALARFCVPADSPCLIESKSFKLYLNSFNQTRFRDADVVCHTLAQDLSAAAGAPVGVDILPFSASQRVWLEHLPAACLDEMDLEMDTYQPAPQFLAADNARDAINETLVSHLLKSNCLVTGQPDWASVIVHYSGAPIDHAGLLRYIVSFRNHNEFHEQCVERMFMDIQRRCRPRQLLVLARYTRRGGLDINPWRSTQPQVPAWLSADPFDARQ